MMGSTELHTSAKLSDRRAHIVRGAAHPFPRRAEDRVLKALVNQPLAHIRVAKDRPVGSFGEFIDVQRVCLLHLPLRLADARVDIRLRRLAHLEQSHVVGWWVVRRPCIDTQSHPRFLREDRIDVLSHLEFPLGV